MTSQLMITGGRVIDPASGLDAETTVYLRGGRIAAVGEKPLDFTPTHLLHVPDHIICPGLIDMSVRLREPGLEYKGTIASETRAAASGGVTTLCCPPDSSPAVDNPAVAELIHEQNDLAGNCRVQVIGAMTVGLEGSRLSEFHALKEAGCIGVSNAFAPLANTLIIRRALEYAATFDLLVFIRPQDHWLANGGSLHEGDSATRMGVAGIPECAETVAVAQYLELIEQTGARAHFSQLSCSRSATMISRSQFRDTQVTADVAIHQLHFTEEDAEGFDCMFHLNPPLRTRADREGLRDAVARGVINAICSDHQPHEDSARQNPFTETATGMSSVQTLLPLTLKLVDEERLSLPQALAALTSEPAAILDTDLGSLQPGLPADLCIFDPDQLWQPEEDNWYSGGRNTPFWGQTLKGRVNATFYKGEPVFIHPDSGLAIQPCGEAEMDDTDDTPETLREVF